MISPNGFSAETKSSPEDIRAEIEVGRQELIRLSNEKKAMVEAGALPDEIQAKVKEIMATRQKLIEQFETLGPSPILPLPPVKVIIPEEEEKLEALLIERRKQVSQGAGSEDVQELTKEIQEIHLSVLKRMRTSRQPGRKPSPALSSAQTTQN